MYSNTSEWSQTASEGIAVPQYLVLKATDENTLPLL